MQSMKQHLITIGIVLISIGQLIVAFAATPEPVNPPAKNVVTTPQDFAFLSWSPPTINDDGTPCTDIVAYRIYRGNGPAALTLYATVKANVLQFRDALKVGQSYTYLVKAVNSKGAESVAGPVVSKSVIVIGGTDTFRVQ